jgi:hypothetical protein
LSKYIDINDELKQFKNSFPHHLESELSGLFSKIDLKSEHSTHWGYQLHLNKQIIEIPSRIYWETNSSIKALELSPIQETMMACIFSRHHDGYTRENNLHKLLLSDNYWVTPFIVQLLGEYVIEILNNIWKNTDKLNLNNLNKFISENEEYWFKTKQRIASYWDCYYRFNNNRNDYVGFKLIKLIESKTS